MWSTQQKLVEMEWKGMELDDDVWEGLLASRLALRWALRTSSVLQMSSVDLVGGITLVLAGSPSKLVSLCIPTVREFDTKENDRIHAEGRGTSYVLLIS